MTAEERRKKHQLELKEQLHEEAKVCVMVYLLTDDRCGSRINTDQFPEQVPKV